MRKGNSLVRSSMNIKDKSRKPQVEENGYSTEWQEKKNNIVKIVNCADANT